MFKHNLKNTTRRKLESQGFFKKIIVLLLPLLLLEVSLIVLSH